MRDIAGKGYSAEQFIAKNINKYVFSPFLVSPHPPSVLA